MSNIQLQTENELQDFISELTKEVLDNSFLDELEEGNLTVKQWHEFAPQRYLSSTLFEELLESTMHKAEKTGNKLLKQVLHENLQDEKGLDTNGNPLVIGSHEQWRQYFYTVLGLDIATLKHMKPSPGTKSYCAVIKTLIKADVVTASAAILFQEYFIPEEFKRIRTGRDKTFYDSFVIKSTDTEDERLHKNRARIYIDNHIAHDAHSHYPALKKALVAYLQDEKEREKIKNGIELIVGAKKKFYKDFSL